MYQKSSEPSKIDQLIPDEFLSSTFPWWRCHTFHNIYTEINLGQIMHEFSITEKHTKSQMQPPSPHRNFQLIRTLCCFFICRRYGTKCSGCGQGIAPSDLVRKPRDKVFHLNCFTCCICRKQLSTGEQLYVLDDNKFICKDDYLLGKGPGLNSMTGELILDLFSLHYLFYLWRTSVYWVHKKCLLSIWTIFSREWKSFKKRQIEKYLNADKKKST